MGTVAEVVAVIAILVALAATLAVYPAVWRALWNESRRIPPNRRRPAWAGAGIAVALSIVVGVLLLLEPWGSKTVLWVALIGVGAVLLLSAGGITAQAAMDVRRARRRRAPDP